MEGASHVGHLDLFLDGPLSQQERAKPGTEDILSESQLLLTSQPKEVTRQNPEPVWEVTGKGQGHR